MVDLISSVDALFSYYGATLFALGLLCALIPRTFKFGVFTLILADIPLALAIAFPRKVIETLNGWGFKPEDFPDVNTGHSYGIIAGVVTFVVLFALRALLKSLWSKRNQSASKSPDSDDEPIELSEDDPSTIELSSDDKKSESGLFKGLKGKKAYQSASALHLSSDDNPLNLDATQANFSSLKKSEESVALGDALGSKNDFALDPHESFSLEPVKESDSDELKEPTLSSDVFTNHMSQDEPHFSNSFIDNAAGGSLSHSYQTLGNEQNTLELSVLGHQNPLTGKTEDPQVSLNSQKSTSSSSAGTSNWSTLFAKINQAQQSAAASKGSLSPQDKAAVPAANPSKIKDSDLEDEGELFSGYRPLNKHQPIVSHDADDVELDTFSFAGNKVGDLLEVMDDPKLGRELLSSKDKAKNRTDKDSSVNFAQLLSSAQEQQNAPQLTDYDAPDHDPDYISEEQLAFAALEQSHKTVAQALADLDSQEQESKADDNEGKLLDKQESALSDDERASLVSKSHVSSPKVLQDNLQSRSLEVVEPTKISYLYNDPVHEDASQEEEEESKEDILERYEGDATNYSFSIKGVFKEKRPLSVAGFIDRASYLEQSQFEANFHEHELENMVHPEDARSSQAQALDASSTSDTAIELDKDEAIKHKRAELLAMARQVAEQMDAELGAKKSQAQPQPSADISDDEAQVLASLFADSAKRAESKIELKPLSGVATISPESMDHAQFLETQEHKDSSLDHAEPLELKSLSDLEDSEQELIVCDQEPSHIDSLKLQESKQDVPEANVAKVPSELKQQDKGHEHNASHALKLSNVELLPQPKLVGEIKSASTAPVAALEPVKVIVSEDRSASKLRSKSKESPAKAQEPSAIKSQTQILQDLAKSLISNPSAKRAPVATAPSQEKAKHRYNVLKPLSRVGKSSIGKSLFNKLRPGSASEIQAEVLVPEVKAPAPHQVANKSKAMAHPIQDIATPSAETYKDSAKQAAKTLDSSKSATQNEAVKSKSQVKRPVVNQTVATPSDKHSSGSAEHAAKAVLRTMSKLGTIAKQAAKTLDSSKSATQSVAVKSKSQVKSPVANQTVATPSDKNNLGSAEHAAKAVLRTMSKPGTIAKQAAKTLDSSKSATQSVAVKSKSQVKRPVVNQTVATPSDKHSSGSAEHAAKAVLRTMSKPSTIARQAAKTLDSSKSATQSMAVKSKSQVKRPVANQTVATPSPSGGQSKSSVEHAAKAVLRTMSKPSEVAKMVSTPATASKAQVKSSAKASTTKSTAVQAVQAVPAPAPAKSSTKAQTTTMSESTRGVGSVGQSKGVESAPKATLKHKRRLSKKVVEDDLPPVATAQELNKALAKDAALAALSTLDDFEDLESQVKPLKSQASEVGDSSSILESHNVRKSASLKKSLRRLKR